MSHSISKVRLVAFYLPQFHPFPENDEWWGKGFTEWTNVTRAKPLFVGHYQPHLPSELGFYDLRLPQVRHEQASLAKAYGIDAFCYHFYWFSGKRLMEKPLEDMLADSSMDMPFCLCWANENWTRRWDAREHDILIEQKYRSEDPRDLLRSMAPYLQDARYLKHQGRRVVIVYRPQQLPEPKAWVASFRDEAASLGIGDLYLVSALTHGNWSYKSFGFDAGVEFPPHGLDRSISRFMEDLGFFEKFRGVLPDYRDVAEFYLNRRKDAGEKVFRTVFPSWDNTARRRERSIITLNGTPENYEYWLHQAIQRTRSEWEESEGLVFINAWNEWAEGCHLEPDHEYGRAFLEATLRAKQGSTYTDWPAIGIPIGSGPSAQERYVLNTGRLVKTRLKKNTIARRVVLAIRDFLRILRGKRSL